MSRVLGAVEEGVGSSRGSAGWAEGHLTDSGALLVVSKPAVVQPLRQNG